MCARLGAVAAHVPDGVRGGPCGKLANCFVAVIQIKGHKGQELIDGREIKL
jgi:hypothetical protein